MRPIHRVICDEWAFAKRTAFPSHLNNSKYAMTKHPIAESESQAFRTQLIALLDGGQAHATFDDAVKNFPAKLRGVVPDGLPYSAWQLLEHIRIAQRDILNFSAPPTGGYHPMKWPEGYWPKESEPSSPGAWDHSISAIHADREKFKALILKPGADLFKPFLWGTGQNLLREALLIADHAAYHIGEMIVLRRLLGAWHK